MEKFTKKPEKPADAKPAANADKPTQITKLPDNLKVGGNLDLTGTKRPEEVEDTKPEADTGEGTPITHLPDDLTVGGDLDLTKKKENPTE